MRIHFIGCMGASMRSLSDIAKKDGFTVSGSDILCNGHSESFIKGADLAVYSSAVSADNVELKYAREHGIKVMSRAEYLARLVSEYKFSAAVAGSHGKTTCTAMLWCIFDSLSPTVHLGGEYNGSYGVAGGKEVFITEACEYRRNFLYMCPSVSVVLNVELDHTDYYGDINDITSAFKTFSLSGKKRVVCGDDKYSEPLKTGEYIAFGTSKSNNVYADFIRVDKRSTSFVMYKEGVKLGKVELKVAGRHNVMNALAAACVGFCYGLDFTAVKNGLESFTGVKRRIELLGEIGGYDIYTDYAHHPHEIEGTLNCFKEAGYNKIAVIFEPHTYTRTQSLLQGFKSSLMLADKIFLTDIYAAREAPVCGVSSQLLCREILDCGKSARCFFSYSELNREVIKLIRGNEFNVDGQKEKAAIAYCGAGTINIAAENLLKEYKSF